jgi:hypothetical protein
VVCSPHEKPAAPIPPPQQTHAAPTTAAPAPPAPEPEARESGWEEPTTVEAPTWDEPPPKQETAAIAEPWPPSTEAAAEPPKVEAAQPTAPVAEEKPEAVEEKPAAAPEPVPEQKPEVKASPAPVAAHAAPALAAQVAATPSPKLSTRPAVRTAARYKIPDQPVTMPLSFGTGLEKVGMQFGSLSLAEDGSVVVQCVICLDFQEKEKNLTCLRM